MPAFRERAFLVCKAPNGELSHGPVITGKEGSVKMPTQCTVGTKPIAVVHTHPDDDHLLPSDADLAETRRHGLQAVCVVKQQQLRCFPVD